MSTEVIALLYPAPGSNDDPTRPLTALVRDSQGLMEVRNVPADRGLLRHAKLAGRFDTGKPIVDPLSREVIGWEIEPLAVNLA